MNQIQYSQAESSLTQYDIEQRQMTSSTRLGPRTTYVRRNYAQNIWLSLQIFFGVGLISRDWVQSD
jgi:hypothetical protein